MNIFRTKLIFTLLLCTTVALFIQSCGVKKHVNPAQIYQTWNLDKVEQINATSYSNMNYGVTIDVVDERVNKNSLSEIAQYVVDSSIPVDIYVSDCLNSVMSNMGFDVYSNNPGNFMLNVSILEFGHNQMSGIISMKFDITLKDYDGKIVYTTTINASERSMFNIPKGYPQAFESALKQINWGAIAGNLKRAEKAAYEPTAQVDGLGETALESTIIRWYIMSAPAGADVHWRVVSSTPSVKNTNQNFLGSTPYESTESFDIMGLTYNNSGNVQIEISCEKLGYITQRKRFNVRQAIDQKEISTKFNLIKEEAY